jgi:hypothetical protein
MDGDVALRGLLACSEKWLVGCSYILMLGDTTRVAVGICIKFEDAI